MRELEEYLAYFRYLSAVPDEEGRAVFYLVDASGQFNLWRKDLQSGCPEQWTFFEERYVSELAPPKGPYPMVLMVDDQGQENHQLYVLRSRREWPRDLTQKPDARHRFNAYSVSQDGRWIAFASTRDNPQVQDIFLLDRATLTFRKVLSLDRWLEPGPFAPDARRLLVIELVDVNTTQIHLLDLETGESRVVIPAEPGSTVGPGPWLPDGSGFFVLSQQGREFFALELYRLDRDSTEVLVEEDHDIEDVALSPKGDVLVWMLNDGGHHRLFVRDWPDGPTREIPLPKGQILSLRFFPDGQRLAMVFSGAKYPPSIWLVDLRTTQTQHWLGGLHTEIPAEELIEPESVVYRSFDGLPIQAWLYRPRGSGPTPVILNPHGGPNWQHRPAYSGLIQYLLAHGIAVFAPNFRGSTGFGKSFMKRINRDWGGGELRDLEEGVKWLLQQDWVDPKRIAVMGGSFGGFATLACLTQIPEYFCCGVDLFGPSNLVTFAKSVPPHWRPLMKDLLGDPEEDREFLLERSPLTHVDRIRVPLLVVQGANDPRVVQQESDQLVNALRERNIPVEYLVFDDEGHGFSKRRNMVKAYKAIAEFLLKHLKGAQGA